MTSKPDARGYEFLKKSHDIVVMGLRDRNPADEPAVDVGVVICEQRFEAIELIGGKILQASPGETAQQEVRLLGSTMVALIEQPL